MASRRRWTPLRRRSDALDRRLPALAALAILLAACGSRGERMPDLPEDPDLLVAERPPESSPGTPLALEPGAGDRQGVHPSQTSTYRMVWSELDYYELIELGEDGELRSEERRLGNDLFRRTSASADFLRLQGTSGDSLVLQRTLRPWSRVLGPFGDQVAYERLDDSTVEGRPVRVFRIALAPPLAPDPDRPMGLEAAAVRVVLGLP